MGLSGPVNLCVGWLSSPRCFLALLAVVSASFPCLVMLLLFTRGTSLLLAAFRVLLCYCSPWERVVVASRQYFSYHSSYVGSSQVFCRVAVVSALFPCLVGCRLRVVSLPVVWVWAVYAQLRIALLDS